MSQETWVQSLGLEDLLEEETATHSSNLAWETPWTGEPGWLWGRKESDTTERLGTHTQCFLSVNPDFTTSCSTHDPSQP